MCNTAAFRAGPAVTGGKTYPVCSPRITPVELAQEYERATGEQTRVQRLSLNEARQLATGMMGKSAALELTELFSCVPVSLYSLSARSRSPPGSARS